MSDRARMTLKKWVFGALASLILSGFVALAALTAGANWMVFCSVFGAAAVTHFGAWMKQHPPEEIYFGDEDGTKV